MTVDGFYAFQKVIYGSAVAPMKTSSNSGTNSRLRLSFTVLIEPDDNGTFHAYCPGLKGLHVDGKSESEALENAAHAADCYVASLVKHDDPLPIGPDFTAERVEELPVIPPGALLRHVEVQWPTQDTSGNR